MSSNPTRDAALDAIAALLANGRGIEAEAASSALLRESPNDVEALRLRAIAELQLGRVDAARATLSLALASAPRSIELL
ncbi:MAG: tetratricopeptide repeat protein, partial [Rhodanobacteraceae bacterium]